MRLLHHKGLGAASKNLKRGSTPISRTIELSVVLSAADPVSVAGAGYDTVRYSRRYPLSLRLRVVLVIHPFPFEHPQETLRGRFSQKIPRLRDMG